MKISSRLKAISEFIDPKDRIIDIGCDHALLDIYLCEEYKDLKVTPVTTEEYGISKVVSMKMKD